MQMSWETLTTGQFLDLYKLSLTEGLEDMERLEQAIGIVYNKTQREIDDMAVPDFIRLSKGAAEFLDVKKIPGKAVKLFKIRGQRFKINYDVTKLKQRQYVEITHFAADPVMNMHLIMASLVTPINKWGFSQKNTAEDHIAIADLMLDVPVVHLYHTCVFFCNVLRNLMDHIRPLLVQEMMEKGVSKEEAEETITNSIKVLDGFIPQQE